MYCVTCKNELHECTCPDIDQRLANIAKSDYVIFQMCGNCGKHYARCKCKYPLWVSSQSVIGRQKMKEVEDAKHGSSL